MTATETPPAETPQAGATPTAGVHHTPKRHGAAQDPRYADHARHPKAIEWAAALSFVGSGVCVVGFAAAYWQNWSAIVLGLFFAGIFLGLGVGVICWGKYFMPQGPFVEERHPLETSEQEKASFGEAFGRGADAIKRRSFLGKLFLAVNGLLGIALIAPLRSLLGRTAPGPEQYASPWRSGSHLVTINGNRIHVDDLGVGGSQTVFPEGYIGSATGVVVLVRPGEGATPTGVPGRSTWCPQGYVAFSKVCTHAGCPVGLYMAEYNELLCPCHQSIFSIDQTHPATQIFGPAPRPLPQLPLGVDSKGYLLAQAGFDEPIGPGFWSRGGLWKGRVS